MHGAFSHKLPLVHTCFVRIQTSLTAAEQAVRLACGLVMYLLLLQNSAAFIFKAARYGRSVVESVPVHEAIKQGTADAAKYIDNYKQTLRNLGACGLRCVCYNFMPVIDWTRTDLEFAWRDGSQALAFDIVDFAAFELHILKRQGAKTQCVPSLATQ
eukprot:5003527-Pleurochrysis_carterae.AAC.3